MHVLLADHQGVRLQAARYLTLLLSLTDRMNKHSLRRLNLTKRIGPYTLHHKLSTGPSLNPPTSLSLLLSSY
jgi:hypothetical protein